MAKPLATVPTEKVRLAVEKLAHSHKRKKAKIAGLKDIIKRQHDALQRLLLSPDPHTPFSLRAVIHQMSTCDPAERPALLVQALGTLDSLH
jgi:hypothetical protein